MTEPRISVIIPTYQRRDIVVRSVRSLADQDYAGAFEVIVVVDGSRDGTAGALRTLELPFPLTVVEQSNQGASAARNHGAALARGRILLFLDDDMRSDRALLAAHDRSHCEGADVVLGHLALDPDSPPSILLAGLEDWARERIARLSVPDPDLTLHDLLTGQLSVRRDVFDGVGGFARAFTAGGSFGNEDIDFGYRLLKAGHKIVFNPAAVAWQLYTVRPADLLRRYRQAGHADVLFARRHPEKAEELFALNEYEGWRDRYLWRPIARLPLVAAALALPFRLFALHRIARGSQSRLTRRAFSIAWRLEYWRGVHEAGGVPAGGHVHVIVYHAIRDLAGMGVAEPYGVAPTEFAGHLDALLRGGYHFIDAAEFIGFLRGKRGIPRRAVLLTFDDAYEELMPVVLPMLVERGIPAVVFAVSGRLGGTNEWDRPLGVPELRLLDVQGLRALERQGIEIGAHSRTHRPLSEIERAELPSEVMGSMADLEAAGIRKPRLFAYPYGMANESVRDAVAEAGYAAAFGIDAGRVSPKTNAFDVPRIEVMRGDGVWKLRWKLATARWRHRPAG